MNQKKLLKSIALGGFLFVWSNFGGMAIDLPNGEVIFASGVNTAHASGGQSGGSQTYSQPAPTYSQPAPTQPSSSSSERENDDGNDDDSYEYSNGTNPRVGTPSKNIRNINTSQSDITPPKITVTWPETLDYTFTSNNPKFSIYGFAIDDGGKEPKVSIEYRGKTRQGWGDVELPVGTTKIIVTDRDRAGNATTRIVTVTRKRETIVEAPEIPQVQPLTPVVPVVPPALATPVEPPAPSLPVIPPVPMAPVIPVPPVVVPAATPLVSQLSKKDRFADTIQHFSRPYVQKLYRLGVINESQSFAPNRPATRAEFINTMVKMLGGGNGRGANSFADVSDSDWFYDSVVAAQQMGIVERTKTFRPYDRINRAEAVKVIVRAYGYDLDKVLLFRSKFKDVSRNDWYAAYAEFARKNSIISGYRNGKFGGADPLTRGQMAKIIWESSQNLINPQQVSNVRGLYGNVGKRTTNRVIAQPQERVITSAATTPAAVAPAPAPSPVPANPVVSAPVLPPKQNNQVAQQAAARKATAVAAQQVADQKAATQRAAAVAAQRVATQQAAARKAAAVAAQQAAIRAQAAAQARAVAVARAAQNTPTRAS